MESCKALLQEEKTLSDYNWKWATHYLYCLVYQQICVMLTWMFLYLKTDLIFLSLYIFEDIFMRKFVLLIFYLVQGSMF